MMQQPGPCTACGHAHRSHRARYVLYRGAAHHGLYNGFDEPFGRCRYCTCASYHEPGLAAVLALAGRRMVYTPPPDDDTPAFRIVAAAPEEA